MRELDTPTHLKIIILIISMASKRFVRGSMVPNTNLQSPHARGTDPYLYYYYYWYYNHYYHNCYHY